MAMTFVEKMFAKYSGENEVIPSQIVTVKPDHLLTHDNTAAIIQKIQPELEKYGVYDTSLSIIVLDHVIPAASEKTATNHKLIREFVNKYKIKHFFDIGCGVCHQIVVEKGLALPGKLLLGSDSHTCSYGAIGAFSSGIDRTEAASLMLTGETWLKVPNSIKITLNGKLSPGVTAKDVILYIIGDISASGANYCSVEFHGDIKQFSVEERFTIANMGVEMGAKNAVFPVDSVTTKYLESIGISESQYSAISPDSDAEYHDVIEHDVSRLEPMVTFGYKPDQVKPVRKMEKTRVDQIYIGSCTNGRIEDLRIAAQVLKGNKISDSVRGIVSPATPKIFRQAMDEGILKIFMDAGFCVTNPTCGACLGMSNGVLAKGEICASTTNRNFNGRMGKGGMLHLMSPATASASAITGYITNSSLYKGKEGL